MFYLILHDELAAIRPVFKFSMIKIVVILMWDQQVLKMDRVRLAAHDRNCGLAGSHFSPVAVPRFSWQPLRSRLK